ncbi:MAG: apolipoprotein N-acyltransferase [Planctomycetes bacterium GWF2_40_8]|nr:MAG: apolipoprotein N-acyltransferase [Planctomycetes bacterium GWF2_40_8]OHB88132.1 MAG: apolipoprotein N-acyltransferase [Planctomycetes bacterium RIFCSPHIGHO2_02_FULL_40_12]OHC01996.1 MAG: apolipoprotein N-acyltransferase [Planctomycetes bacterium RIFCSPLOWO2_12_FULL_40_19]
MHKNPFYINIFLSFLTILLLSLSFPSPGISYLAWFALVPWFIIISTGYRTGLFSYLIGVSFLVFNLSWLRFVTSLGWLLLSLYIALYFFAFGAVLYYLRRKLRLPHVFIAPFVWVAFEYLRSFPYTGFPWFFAGHSQYLNLPLIQITDITGVYGISFLIVVINAAIADLTEQLLFKRNYKSGIDSVVSSDKKGKMFWFTIIIPSLLLSLVLVYGYLDLRDHKVLQDGPNVCVVQGNVPQGVKITTDKEQQKEILKKYTNLSLKAAGEEVDMIVWPETMVPGVLNIDPNILNREVDRLSKEAVHKLTDATSANLILGGTAIDVRDASALYFNTAFYFNRQGRFVDRYDKIYLVPFGEFIPFEDWLPFFSNIVPYSVSLSGGGRRTIFELDTKNDEKKYYKFGIIICYEDTVAPLVRRFRKDGADFMINITNDAWFHDSSELDQHLAIMVFRAVENRICITRSANSGISSFIAPNGEIYDYLANEGRYKEVEGILCNKIRFENSVTSWYTNHGDVFAISCLLVTSILFLAALTRRIFA